MHKHEEIERLVLCLSQGNSELATEVMTELKELLIEESEGCWKVNTQSALRLAFELDRASGEAPLPSQMETHHTLLQLGANPTLVNQIFARRGVNA